MRFSTLLLIILSVPLFAQIKTSEILYEIRTDKPVYQQSEEVQWHARLLNIGMDTLIFDAPDGGSFFEWVLVDTAGMKWDTWAVLDSLRTYVIPPGDSLTHQWITDIDRAYFPLQPNQYYGLMKPYYKYDSLQTDSTSFVVSATIPVRQAVIPEIKDFRIVRLFPNPFNIRMQIDFEILNEGFYDLSIFDLSGRKISTLITARLNTGNYSFTWNAGDFSSGVYLVQLSDGRQVLTQKALLIK